MGELSVHVKDSAGYRRELWSKKGDQGNKWISGEATISNISSMSYQVGYMVNQRDPASTRVVFVLVIFVTLLSKHRSNFCTINARSYIQGAKTIMKYPT